MPQNNTRSPGAIRSGNVRPAAARRSDCVGFFRSGTAEILDPRLWFSGLLSPIDPLVAGLRLKAETIMPNLGERDQREGDAASRNYAGDERENSLLAARRGAPQN